LKPEGVGVRRGFDYDFLFKNGYSYLQHGGSAADHRARLLFSPEKMAEECVGHPLILERSQSFSL